jgi:hypothetical protein
MTYYYSPQDIEVFEKIFRWSRSWGVRFTLLMQRIFLKTPDLYRLPSG